MRKYLILGVICLIFLIVLISGVRGNVHYAEEGTVKVLTQWGAIRRVYTPSDGWFLTMLPGQNSYDVNLRSFTHTATPRVTSKDNAALQVPISVTAATDSGKVTEYIRKFGFSQDERYKRRDEILAGLVQTEARNAFSEYNAYEIYANQESIQKRIVDSLKPLLAAQLYLVMESVQIGNPDFLDDRIEQAASAVVANEKQKQAEEARLAAAEVSAKTKQIEAQTYSNPALFELRKLELLFEIEKVRAGGISGHQGPLTIVYGSGKDTSLQIQPASK